MPGIPTRAHHRWLRRLSALPLVAIMLLGMGSAALAETPDVPNAIPGVPANPSPVIGDVGLSGDASDVYSRVLAEGDTIAMALVGWEQISALTPLGSPPVLRLQTIGTVIGNVYLNQSLNYTVPPGGAGTYFLVLSASAGAGRYTFNYQVTPAPGGGGAGGGSPQSGNVSVSANVDIAPPSLTFSISPGISPVGGTVSATAIDFGTLAPDTPKTGTHVLSVTTNSASGYMVTAAENHPLTSGTNQIPDVLGDDGSITDLVSGPWSLAATYGFGFTLTGADAAFTGNYRHFADATAGEASVAVMSNAGAVAASEVHVGYKVNIGSTQPNGSLGERCTRRVRSAATDAQAGSFGTSAAKS